MYERDFKLNNIASPFGNVRFTPSYLYDIDPTLGSTAMPGFSEMMGFYRFYRFRKCKWSVKAVNQEAFPVTVAVVPVNFDPTVNSASYQNYFSNLASKRVLVGSIGCPTEKMSGSFTLGDFGGSTEQSPPPLDAYCGTGTSTPGNNLWLFIGFSSPTGQVSTAAGCAVSLALEIEADYFELTSPAS